MVRRVLGEWEDKQCSALVDNALSGNSPLCLLCYVRNNFTRPGFGTCALFAGLVACFCSGWGDLFQVVSGFKSVCFYLNVHLVHTNWKQNQQVRCGVCVICLHCCYLNHLYVSSCFFLTGML